LEPDSVVDGIDPGSLDRTLQRVEALTDFLEPLLADPQLKEGMRGILKGLGKLGHDLGSMLDENRGDIRESVRNLRHLTAELRGRTAELGPIVKNAGSILSDANTKKALQSLGTLQASLDKLDRILSRIESKQGTVGILVYDDETAENLRSLLSDLKRHPWKLLWKK
jgi:phospholipid/cholesterol/gamma-HCH transport system substrate-binding protein